MRKNSTDQVNIWSPKALGTVECMTARYRRQRFSPHFHEGYCLGVIESGALGFRYRGRGLVAPVGCVNLAMPGEVHDGHGARGDGWSYRMFYIPARVLADAAGQMASRECAAPHFQAGVLRDQALAAAIRSLHRDMESGLASSLEVQTRFLGLMAVWIDRYGEEAPRSREVGVDHLGLERARDMLQERYNEDVTLSELAAEAGLSRWHLARSFAVCFGLPPHAYLTQVRVERAAQALRRGEPPVRVAMETGFADQSHLTRWFKRHKGVTPARYRNIVQDR